MPSVLTVPSYPTGLDIAKLHTPSGDKKLPMVYSLYQDNAITQVMPFIMGNQPFGHLSAAESYAPLPTPTEHGIGVLPNFNKFVQNYDTFMYMPDTFEIPVSTCNMYGDPASYRLEQVLGRIRALGRELAQLLFYGNLATSPTQINGLAVRYNHLSTANSPTALNVISGGGTTASAQTSIWFLGMSPLGVTGIYPNRPGEGKGFVGFSHVDEGRQTVTNAYDTTGGTSGRLPVWRDWFEFNGGLALVNWQTCIRIPNCDTVDLASSNPQTDLKSLMEKALAHRPHSNNVAPEPGVSYPQPVYWWMFNRFIRQALGLNLLSTMIQGAGIRSDNVRNPNSIYMDGFVYGGRPVGICDVITKTESVVGN